MSNIELGYCKGEICNRNGCTGIIDEHDDGESCSCHINPPCSHCENNDQYCPECAWSNIDEENEYRKAHQPTQQQIDQWAKEREDAKKRRIENKNLVDAAYNGKVKVDKIVSYVTKSWHSGYAVKGCAPIGTTWIEIKKHFNCNYDEAMAQGGIDSKTGGFTLSQFTD